MCIRDSYNAYDTLAVVDNLQKKFEEGDILPESEIISNQAPACLLYTSRCV